MADAGAEVARLDADQVLDYAQDACSCRGHRVTKPVITKAVGTPQNRPPRLLQVTVNILSNRCAGHVAMLEADGFSLSLKPSKCQ